MPPFRVRPLARDQLAMPPQNSVGCDDRGHLAQPATAQPVPAHGESTPVVIAQPHAPPMQLAPEDAILFDQVGQSLLLTRIPPADQGGEKNPQENSVDHGRRVYLTAESQSPAVVGLSCGTLRGRVLADARNFADHVFVAFGVLGDVRFGDEPFHLREAGLHPLNFDDKVEGSEWIVPA